MRRRASPSLTGSWAISWEQEVNDHWSDQTDGGERSSRGRKTAAPLPLWIWVCLAAGVLALALSFLPASIPHYGGSKIGSATDEDSVPTVAVVHPAPSGAAAQEIVLPGNVMAFIDTPHLCPHQRISQGLVCGYRGAREARRIIGHHQLPEVDRQLQQARADLLTAQTNAGLAQSNATRYQGLLSQNAVSQQARIPSSLRRTPRVRQSKSAQANVQRLEEMQSFEKIYAPFDGVITARNIDIGGLIAAGQTRRPRNSSIFPPSANCVSTFPCPKPIRNLCGRALRGTLTLDEFPGEVFHGVIVRNAHAIDSASRTLNVEIDVDNPQGQIMPGAYAFVHLRLCRRNIRQPNPWSFLPTRCSSGQKVCVSAWCATVSHR